MAGLGVGYQPGTFRFSLSLGASLPQVTSLNDRGIGARSTALSGSVAGCVVPVLPPLRLVACAELGLTMLRVEGRGTERDQDVTVPLYGVGPSLGAEWWLGQRAFVSVSFASRFYVTRPELVVEALPERLRAEVVSGNALFGGGVRW
jgi:hypothetical protein